MFPDVVETLNHLSIMVKTIKLPLGLDWVVPSKVFLILTPLMHGKERNKIGEIETSGEVKRRQKWPDTEQ